MSEANTTAPADPARLGVASGEAWGVQKAHDFAAQVRRGQDAEHRFREAAVELGALLAEAAAHGLALAKTLDVLGEKVEALARGRAAAPVRERDAAPEPPVD